MVIKLVRHGQSQTNSGDIPHGSTGDHKIGLTQLGISEARRVGEKLKESGFNFDHCLLYSSPYARAQATMAHLLIGANEHESGHSIYQDPRLREVDHGYSDVAAQETMRKEHGWFYYRFKGGESPADCYDRCCTFTESLTRQILRKSIHRLILGGSYIETRKDGSFNAEIRHKEPIKYPHPLIVMHGLTMRCFVTRFMHLTIDQFETLANPKNCDIVTIGHKELIDDPQFVCGKWAVTGLRFRKTDKEMSALT